MPDNGYSATNMLMTFSPLLMRLYQTMSDTHAPYENKSMEDTLINNDLPQGAGTRDDEAVDDEAVISNNQYEYTNGRNGYTTNNGNNNTWQRVNSQQQSQSVSESERTGEQKARTLERILDTSTDKTDMFETVYKRGYIDCDITKITLNMVVQYLKTGRVCGIRTSRVRFGLGK